VMDHKDILDGTSFTYLVGEKSVNPQSYRTGRGTADGSWPGAGFDFGGKGLAHRAAFRVPWIDRENGCFECHDFGSAHRSGWYMSFIDGSVRRLNYDMAFPVHASLASVAAGDVESHFIDQELPEHLNGKFKVNSRR